MQAETPRTGRPFGARRLVPQGPIQLPRPAGVAALEQRSGGDARVEEAVRLAGLDHPRPGDRRAGILGEGGPIGLLPLPERILREVQVRTVLAVGDARAA